MLFIVNSYFLIKLFYRKIKEKSRELTHTTQTESIPQNTLSITDPISYSIIIASTYDIQFSKVQYLLYQSRLNCSNYLQHSKMCTINTLSQIKATKQIILRQSVASWISPAPTSSVQAIRGLRRRSPYMTLSFSYIMRVYRTLFVTVCVCHTALIKATCLLAWFVSSA